MKPCACVVCCPLHIGAPALLGALARLLFLVRNPRSPNPEQVSMQDWEDAEDAAQAAIDEAVKT